MKSKSTTVAERWSALVGSDAFSPEVYWLAIPKIRERHIRRMTNGGHDWIEFVCSNFFPQPAERMLNIGCGNGQLERRLASRGVFEHCDAFDLSPDLVERARRNAGEHAGKLHYRVDDANTMKLPPGTYDAVWFNSALHHVEALEHACQEVNRSLREDGLVIVNEYVGPSRFAFSERQKEAMRGAWNLIPRRLRRSFAPNRYGRTQEQVAIPDPEQVALQDPSEAVRSAEIVQILENHFDLIHRGNAGGTILHFLLCHIAGNFRPNDTESMRILDMLMNIEDTLVDAGDLGSDFALLIGRRR